jgi:hypothetical protein
MGWAHQQGHREMRTPTSSFLIILASLSLVSGCAVPFSTGPTEVPRPPIDKNSHANIISFQDFQEKGVALSGIVIRQGVDIHRYPDLPAPGERFDHCDQTEFWSSNCEREFADNISSLDLTPFQKFDDFIEDDLLTAIWARHAQGGHLDPELLNAVHSAGPGVRFLLLIRVEYDDISHDINTSYSMHQNSAAGLGRVSAGGHDPDQVNKSSRPTIKRVVGLTMSIYDLELAICAWESGVYEDVSQKVDPQTLNDFEGYQAKKIETGEVMVVEEEQFPDSPAFNWVMDKCLDKLYTDMIRKVDPSFRGW